MPVDVHRVLTPTVHHSTGAGEGVFSPVNRQALLSSFDPTPAVHSSTGAGEGVFSPVNRQALLCNFDPTLAVHSSTGAEQGSFGQAVLYGSHSDCQSSQPRQRTYLHTPYPFSLRLDALSNRVMCEGEQAHENAPLRHDPEGRAGVQLPAFGCGIMEEVLV